MANTLELGNGKWATGKDTVLAFNDENNNFKPLPFSFSRASSGTVVNKDGLIETVGIGEPRIDFKDNIKGALKLEPSRTNVIINSENLNGAGWSVYGASGGTVTRTSNYGISPSGELNSTRVVFSDTTTALYASASGITDNASASIYVKGTVGEIIGFGFGGSVAGGSDFIFNGEWQRLEFNGTSASSNLTINTWSASRNARDFEVYGVQMEQGSYATSYIPTSGQANGVTRVQDLVVGIDTLQDLSLLGSNEGTWLVDMKDMFFEITGTGVGSMYLYQDNTNQIEFVAKSNTTCKITINNSTALDNIGGENKIAISWDANGLVIYKNGVAAYTTSSNEYSNPYTHLFLVKNTRQSKKHINNTQLYNTRLSNSELAALTTI